MKTKIQVRTVELKKPILSPMKIHHIKKKIRENKTLDIKMIQEEAERTIREAEKKEKEKELLMELEVAPDISLEEKLKVLEQKKEDLNQEKHKLFLLLKQTLNEEEKRKQIEKKRLELIQQQQMQEQQQQQQQQMARQQSQPQQSSPASAPDSFNQSLPSQTPNSQNSISSQPQRIQPQGLASLNNNTRKHLLAAPHTPSPPHPMTSHGHGFLPPGYGQMHPMMNRPNSSYMGMPHDMPPQYMMGMGMGPGMNPVMQSYDMSIRMMQQQQYHQMHHMNHPGVQRPTMMSNPNHNIIEERNRGRPGR